MAAAEGWIYRFGDVEVEPAAHRVTRAGVDLAVEPKAYAVLVALLEEHGRALERDALLDRVWGHRHVTPGVLNRVIAQLRKALGDEAEHPHYIQTLHSLGYRFIADVVRVPVAPLDAPVIPAGEAPTPAAEALPSMPGSEPEASPGSVRTKAPWWKRKPVHALVAAVALVAIVVLLGLYGWRAAVRPAEASIAVVPFTSLSSNRDDSYFAEGLAIEMHDALAGVEGLKVAAQLAPADATRHEVDMKTLGRQLGVATVLDASVRREGQHVRINARLSDTRSGYTLWSHTYDRQLSDVFATQSEIAGEVVRSLLGAMPKNERAIARRLTPTRDVKAYDAYLRGLQQLQSGDDAKSTGLAINFFSEALAADHGFARAQAGICRSHLREFERDRNADRFVLARKACEKAEKMDPDLADVNLALAELHRGQGEYGKAIGYYSRAGSSPALAASAYVGMAKAHASQGRIELSLQYFERARKLRPNDYAIPAEMGYQQYLRGDIAGAIQAYKQALQLHPDDDDLWSSLGGLYITAGDREKAAEAFKRSLAIKPNSSALGNYGWMVYEDGHYAAAVDLLRKAVALDADDFIMWGNLGDALLADPATAAQAREPFMRATEMASRYIEIKPDDAKALANLGWYLANLGKAPAARELVSRSEALGTDQGEVALVNAQTLVVLNDVENARKRVADARRLGIAERRIRSSPSLRRIVEVPQIR